MGFIKARQSDLYHAEKGEGLPIPLIHPAAFRERAYRRWRRQVSTLARAVRAGRSRAKADPQRAGAPVNGQALRDLVATVAADARLVRVPVRQPPWTPTSLAVTTGDDVSWLAWGSPYLVWPLSVAVRPRLTLRGRVDDGVAQDGTRDTVTFRADRTGELRLGSVYPGELQADGTITMDRIPTGARSRTGATVRPTSWPAPEPTASAAGSTRNDPCSPTTRPRSAGRRRHVWSAPGSSRKPSPRQATRRVSSAGSTSSRETRHYACSDRRTARLPAGRPPRLPAAEPTAAQRKCEAGAVYAPRWPAASAPPRPC